MATTRTNRHQRDRCACGGLKATVSKRCWDCHSVGLRTLRELVAIESEDCVEWPHGRDPRTGYGRLSHKGERTTAHRVAYELTHGPIPDGMHVLHRCDNRPCVNARRHLFLGTNRDNIDDMVAKGRNRRGEDCPWTHLTTHDVLQARKLASEGVTRDTIAAHFGVSRQAINDIVWRKTWRHV